MSLYDPPTQTPTDPGPVTPTPTDTASATGAATGSGSSTATATGAATGAGSNAPSAPGALVPGSPTSSPGQVSSFTPTIPPPYDPALLSIPDDHVAFVRLGATVTPVIGNRAKPYPTLAAAFAAVEAAAGGAGAYMLDLGVGSFSLTLTERVIGVLLQMRGPAEALCSVTVSVTGTSQPSLGSDGPPITILQQGVTVSVTSRGGIGYPAYDGDFPSDGNSNSVCISGGACSYLSSPSSSVYSGQSACNFYGVRFTNDPSHYTLGYTYTQFYGCDLTGPAGMFGSIPQDMGGNSGVNFPAAISAIVAGLLPPVGAQVKSAGFYPSVGGYYITTGTFTLGSSWWEPTASQVGDSYTILVAAGVLTFADGTILMPSSTPVQRIWNGSAWTTFTGRNQQVISTGSNLTLTTAHNGKLIRVTASCQITMPTSSSITGPFQVEFIFEGTSGQITFAAGSGNTLNSYPNGNLKLAAKFAKATIDRTTTNTYNLSSPFLTA